MKKDYRNVPTSFGLALRAARLELGISQESLASIAGLDRTYVSGTERGKKNPTLITITRLAGGLGLTASQLLERVERIAL